MSNFWSYVFIILIGLAGGLAFFGIAALLVFLAEHAFFGVRKLYRIVFKKEGAATWVQEEEHEREAEAEAAEKEEQLAAIDTLSSLDLDVDPATVPVAIHTVPVIEDTTDEAPDVAAAPVQVAAEQPSVEPESEPAVAAVTQPRSRRRQQVTEPVTQQPEATAATEEAAPVEESMATDTPAAETATDTTVEVASQPAETSAPERRTPIRFPRRRHSAESEAVAAPVPPETQPAAVEPAEEPSTAPESPVDPLAELRARLARRG